MASSFCESKGTKTFGFDVASSCRGKRKLLLHRSHGERGHLRNDLGMMLKAKATIAFLTRREATAGQATWTVSLISWLKLHSLVRKSIKVRFYVETGSVNTRIPFPLRFNNILCSVPRFNKL